MSGIRYKKEDRDIMAKVKEETGIPTDSGVVRLGLKALAARYQSGSFPVLQGWPDVGQQILADALDGAGQVRPLEALAIGSVIIYPPGGKELYRLSAKYQQSSDMQFRCVLRPIEPGGKVHHLDDGTLCEVVSRLDERLPVFLLQLDDFQTRVLLALAPGGALSTEQLFRASMKFMGRDTARMKISLSQLGPFVGRLLSGLAAAELIAFSGNNPLEAAWSLSERGQELAKYMKL